MAFRTYSFCPLHCKIPESLRFSQSCSESLLQYFLSAQIAELPICSRSKVTWFCLRFQFLTRRTICPDYWFLILPWFCIVPSFIARQWFSFVHTFLSFSKMDEKLRECLGQEFEFSFRVGREFTKRRRIVTWCWPWLRWITSFGH